MKISVVVTVYNEEKSIEYLLDSLNNQTMLPDEVIIVDASSKDSTVKTIEEWGEKHRSFPISVIVRKWINRSKARNIGIRKAKNEIIAMTDAGCRADKQWLKLLAERYKSDGVEAGV